MSNIKLTYFDSQGPTEPTRLAFTMGGIAFEDIRIGQKEMSSLKSSGKLLSGQVPLLEVGGECLTQSSAMARYAAKLAGMYPESPWDAAKVDEVIQLVTQDIIERLINPTIKIKNKENQGAMRKKLAEEKLPEKLAILESMMGEWEFFFGDTPTLADLYVYNLLNWLGMEVLEGVPKQVRHSLGMPV
jgi:glutathione S-transferase